MTLVGSPTLGSGEAVPSDSAALTQFRINVESAACDLQRTIAGVEAQRAIPGWSGSAQEKYSRQIETLTHELRAVLSSLESTDHLVSGFVSQLGSDFEATAARLARELALAEGAAHELSAATSSAIAQRSEALAHGEASFGSAVRAREAPAYMSADATARRLSQEAARTEEEVERLRREARENFEQYDAAARRFSHEVVDVAASVGVSALWQSNRGPTQIAYDSWEMAWAYANAAAAGI